jgi:hypothetical protein
MLLHVCTRFETCDIFSGFSYLITFESDKHRWHISTASSYEMSQSERFNGDIIKRRNYHHFNSPKMNTSNYSKPCITYRLTQTSQSTYFSVLEFTKIIRLKKTAMQTTQFKKRLKQRLKQTIAT